MAEEANALVAVDATKPVDESTRPTDAGAEPVVAEAKPAEDGVVATSGVTEVPATSAADDAATTQENGTADAAQETKADNNDAESAPAADASETTDTPAAKKAANGKRKAGPAKTPAKKKGAAKKLILDAKPGDMYMVAMRGYQPWPVIICDEDMLPESLLSKRPVSAKRIDGTYREDFQENGKNVKDRRYPVMFLSTNEFAWQVNTDLLEFDLAQVKKDVEEDNQKGKKKALWEAYQVAAEGHDLEHFKELLKLHEQAMQEDLEQREQKEIQKKEKAEKAAKRKSTAAVDDSDDVEMQDVEDAVAPSAKKAKGSKKRKKGDESDGENEKPAKTPKTKLKLNNKTPKEASAAKPKKETKSKKKASEEAPAVPEEPPLSREEELQKREKQVLYLRHRLQKGFLSRDQAPKDEDMTSMSDYLTQLEAIENLEAEIIKKTKVNKVLKAIIKLGTIPKEEEFKFKPRSSDLLGKWNSILAADSENTAPVTSVAPSTNGLKHEEEEKKSDTEKDEPSVEKLQIEEKKEDVPAPTSEAAENDGDVAMSEADKEVSKDASPAQTDADTSTAIATGADQKVDKETESAAA